MRNALCIAAVLASLHATPAHAAETQQREEVQADISTREVHIKADFTGIEILIFGSVDFSQAPTPEEGEYDVVIVIEGPSAPMVARRKERVAGIFVNTKGQTFPSVPGFYAVLSSRPFRAITSDAQLKALGIGLNNLDFGRPTYGDLQDSAYRAAVIRLKQQQDLFQEHDDGVAFIGRSLFRATVDLPVSVPIGHYTSSVYLFRDGALFSKKESTLEVNKVGFEQMIYSLAFSYPFLYGLLAVAIAIVAGLIGWLAFRRE
ncbi:TIGR02186 family protein [Methyloceanibacter sp.]|jgi:uncharacterized protein (TIGR02186 family)|uniref:TIGR02186 family protein n=1 Tax=Methyloceanibacter sp. TaxID=1965321 RepID=UPI002C950BFD|nr:TIGR02186 family protein [Methyloceanibacter sp.]